MKYQTFAVGRVRNFAGFLIFCQLFPNVIIYSATLDHVECNCKKNNSKKATFTIHFWDCADPIFYWFYPSLSCHCEHTAIVFPDVPLFLEGLIISDSIGRENNGEQRRLGVSLIRLLFFISDILVSFWIILSIRDI